MLVDSHCHLDRLKLGERSLDTAIAEAGQRDVSHMLCISISDKNVADVLAIAQRFPQIYASVGVHPLDIEDGAMARERLMALTKAEKVVAVGETGLDYYYSKEAKTLQQESFAMHLEVGAETGLPIVVHTRDARADTIALIKAHGNVESAGVLHCFTEDVDMAQAAMDLGYYISLSGIVTFKNAEALREVARYVPLDRLLVETDSPYLAPVPYRGKSNEPKYVREVAEFVAQHKGVSFETLARQTTENFFTLFNRAQPVDAKEA
ncbi:TatD family hydrolase [Simiduia sp. 21SJ11W-1]|uniref:TatD family hydrolase n=1 Tax=Simiduia sp. 21SJ11W-1 TaxID=2909669 RepID=UPI00209F2571|nr:TatD family hydrolase [Simiduia sp. 21SJ11W-1]UTA46336.1 TatD family hydrolase [Simiduia sp. 21SJ11W-1]